MSGAGAAASGSQRSIGSQMMKNVTMTLTTVKAAVTCQNPGPMPCF